MFADSSVRFGTMDVQHDISVTRIFDEKDQLRDLHVGNITDYPRGSGGNWSFKAATNDYGGSAACYCSDELRTIADRIDELNLVNDCDGTTDNTSYVKEAQVGKAIPSDTRWVL